MAEESNMIVNDSARSLLYATDTLGCLEHVLAKTVDYAKQRTTFGAPIGKYQAVAHRLVDHTVTTRQLRLLLAGAASSMYGGPYVVIWLSADPGLAGWLVGLFGMATVAKALQPGIDHLTSAALARDQASSF